MIENKEVCLSGGDVNGKGLQETSKFFTKCPLKDLIKFALLKKIESLGLLELEDI